jgi:hypothetical protein
MNPLSLFIPITKVDAAQRLVFGLATAECEDRVGEICDYASTKPLYEKWSQEIQKATDGRSLGNLRAMHGKVAAGKITSLSFDDSRKQIEICAKVVDDGEWDKVCEGVYTGFSQGGVYAKRWRDQAGLMRYTAEPNEISLVDLPCLPNATFQMIKADGRTEVLPFRPETGAEEWEQVWKSKRDGATFKTKADLRKHHEELDALAKVGARNSKADLALIQEAHDNLVQLGASCGAPQKAHTHAAEHAQVAKLDAEPDALAKTVAGMQSVLNEILLRVKAVERQPQPLPVSGETRTISKSEELIELSRTHPGEVAKFVDANREALALEAIKIAQRHPLTMGARR